MRYGRDLIENYHHTHALYGIWPLEVKDPVAYAAFAGEIVKHKMPAPWCAGMRLVFRDLPGVQPLKKTIALLPRVHQMRINLGQDAVFKSLEKTAYDDAQPLPMRMQNLTIAAMMDYSHRRYKDALKKYDLCLRYYEAHNDPLMHALSLQGIGDTFFRAGSLDKGRRYLEEALVVATKSGTFAVVLQAAYSLGDLNRTQKRYDDAISYFDTVCTVGAVLGAGDIEILSKMWTGECQLEKGATKEAALAWVEAEELAEEQEAHELREQVLQHQLSLYKRHRLRDRVTEVEKKIRDIRTSTGQA